MCRKNSMMFSKNFSLHWWAMVVFGCWLCPGILIYVETFDVSPPSPPPTLSAAAATSSSASSLALSPTASSTSSAMLLFNSSLSINFLEFLMSRVKSFVLEKPNQQQQQHHFHHHHHHHYHPSSHNGAQWQSQQNYFNDLLIRPDILLFQKLFNSTFLENIFNDRIKLMKKLNFLVGALFNHTTATSTTVMDQRSINSATMTSSLSNLDLNDLVFKDIKQSIRRSFSKSKKNRKPFNSTSSFSNLIGRCYPPYGCFRITEPFRTIYRPINLIPEPPTAVRVSFYLRTRANPSLPERLSYNGDSKFVLSDRFRPDLDLKLIIHGYLEGGDEPWITEMSGAFLNNKDCNVITVDWLQGAIGPYSQAVANTRLIGAIIAHFIKTIQSTFPFESEKIHLIGHSLGAHVAGYTGQIIDIGKITGLDPAEPYFQNTDPSIRLDSGDAKQVEIVHTDIGSILNGGFGMSQPCGHVDFYPNGGIDQPGCSRPAPIKDFMDSIGREGNIFDGIRRFIGCNHFRSFRLYTESINSECPFMAYPCANYEEFTTGQCTSKLFELSGRKFDQLCGNVNSSSISKNICPIRLFGPKRTPPHTGGEQTILAPNARTKTITKMAEDNDDEDLKINELSNTSLNNSVLMSIPNGNRMAYFFRTNDRPPYCFYHYHIRLVFSFVDISNHHRSSNHLGRIRDPTREANFNFPSLNGKFQLTLVGSRGRTTAETIIKQDDLKHSDDESNFFSKRNSMENGMKLYHADMLIGASGLGRLIRAELNWFPLAVPARSASLNTIQATKTTLKKLWQPQRPFNTMVPDNIQISTPLMENLQLSTLELNRLFGSSVGGNNSVAPPTDQTKLNKTNYGPLNSALHHHHSNNFHKSSLTRMSSHWAQLTNKPPQFNEIMAPPKNIVNMNLMMMMRNDINHNNNMVNKHGGHYSRKPFIHRNAANQITASLPNSHPSQFEAIIIEQLETNRKTIFCSQSEPIIRNLFHSPREPSSSSSTDSVSSSSSSSVMLIAPNYLDPSKVQSAPASTPSISTVPAAAEKSNFHFDNEEERKEDKQDINNNDNQSQHDQNNDDDPSVSMNFLLSKYCWD